MEPPNQNLHTGSRAQSEGNEPVTNRLWEGKSVKCSETNGIQEIGNGFSQQLSPSFSLCFRRRTRSSANSLSWREEEGGGLGGLFNGAITRGHDHG